MLRGPQISPNALDMVGYPLEVSFSIVGLGMVEKPATWKKSFPKSGIDICLSSSGALGSMITLERDPRFLLSVTSSQELQTARVLISAQEQES